MNCGDAEQFLKGENRYRDFKKQLFENFGLFCRTVSRREKFWPTNCTAKRFAKKARPAAANEITEQS